MIDEGLSIKEIIVLAPEFVVSLSVAWWFKDSNSYIITMENAQFAEADDG